MPSHRPRIVKKKRVQRPGFQARQAAIGKVPKPPALSPMPDEQVTAAPPKYDYETGTISWKGITITREEAIQFIQMLGRTPVSRGRFPTEADFIIQEYNINTKRPKITPPGSAPGQDTRQQEEDLTATRIVTERAEQWRRNYLKAVEGLIETAQTAEEQDNWDELYNLVNAMPIDDFLDMMSRFGDELGTVFVFSPPDAYAPAGYEISKSLLDRWRGE